MKTIVTTIIASAILLASCAEATESADTKSEDSNTKQKQAEAIEEVLLPEGSEVEEDHRYDNMSTESVSSPCQIVSHFIDMDINYVTVDLVNITQGTENSQYGIENDDLTLRTFVVNEEYLDMYTDANVSVEKMFENASNDAEMLFLITVEDGLVTEFYEMDTASIYQ